MVEEIEKSTKPEEPEKSSSSARPSDGGEAADGPEEGEIVGESNEMPNPDKGLTAKHPLENAWTFWFDNPSAKSKQAAWGSSIRPVYTFSTVEDFWRYPLVCIFI